MVSKKLQDKFYAALESLRDGKNDYILEALAAGAKATFEGLLTGQVSDDGTYIPSKYEVPRSASIGPDSCPRVLTQEDIQMLTHDPETEHEEDPEELNFDGNEAKRFPTYPGQFNEKEDPFYSMVAEAVTKLGNTINELKTTDNAPLIEAIEEGFECCFGTLCEATDPDWIQKMREYEAANPDWRQKMREYRAINQQRDRESFIRGAQSAMHIILTMNPECYPSCRTIKDEFDELTMMESAKKVVEENESMIDELVRQYVDEHPEIYHYSQVSDPHLDDADRKALAMFIGSKMDKYFVDAMKELWPNP